MLLEQRDAVDRERRQARRREPLAQLRPIGPRRASFSRPVSVMWKRNSSMT